MTENNIFPKTLSQDAKGKITQLAETIYNKKISELTRDNIVMLIQMDMTISMKTLTVGATATRPSNIKFATNNYHASVELNIGEVFKLMTDRLQSIEQDKLIDEYLTLKQVVYNMIAVKYDSTEHYLRFLLEKVIEKDGCPKVGRFETS